MTRAAFVVMFAGCAFSLTVNAESGKAETLASDAPRAIAMEVLIVRANWGTEDERSVPFSGPTGEVAARLLGLESTGQIVVIDRIRLTTLENQKAMVQAGMTTPVASGRSSAGRGGPAQMLYQQQNLGTMISATARIEGDEIVVKLDVEKSQLERRSKSQADDRLAPPGTETLTSQATVRIGNGRTVLASGLETRADAESSGQFILASARLLEPSTNADVATTDGMSMRQIRMFSLKHASAKDAASLVDELNNDDSGRMRVGVDLRTNSLIVSADNAHHLDVHEAVLLRLDESEPWMVSETPQDEKKPDATRLVTKYDEMGKPELQDELRRLQAQLIDAERTAHQASDGAREAAHAYNSASDDEKADALLRMIEAEAASRTPMEHYRQARSALDAAKRSYLDLITAE